MLDKKEKIVLPEYPKIITVRDKWEAENLTTPEIIMWILIFVISLISCWGNWYHWHYISNAINKTQGHPQMFFHVVRVCILLGGWFVFLVLAMFTPLELYDTLELYSNNLHKMNCYYKEMIKCGQDYHKELRVNNFNRVIMFVVGGSLSIFCLVFISCLVGIYVLLIIATITTFLGAVGSALKG